MILGIVAALLAGWFFFNLYSSWNENYWLKRGVPYLENRWSPLRILGDIKDVILLKKTIGEVHGEIYRRFEGKPFGGFFKLRTPSILLRDPTIIGKVLRDDFDKFHDNDVQLTKGIDPIFKMNPFVNKGASWKSIRSVLSPCESPENLKNMVPLCIPICQKMVVYVKDRSNSSIEVWQLSGKFMTDVIGSLVFGLDCDSFQDQLPEFTEMTGKLFRTGIRTKIALLCAFYAPKLGNILKFRIIPKKIAEYFINVVTESCRKRVQENGKRPDFLQKFIDINRESEDNGEGTVYNYKQIAGHSITFFSIGFYPSTSTLCYCLYELARNPNYQEKLREEAKTKFGDGIESLTYDKLEEMEYLRRFVSECLRLHPPIQSMTRLCTEATVLEAPSENGGGKCPIEVGTPVVIPLSALQKDPNYYPEPDKFDPDRFDLGPQKDTYLPFGGGPRTCLGVGLALMQLKLALISIVSNFKVELSSDFSPSGLKVDPSQSYLRTPQGDVRLLFQKIE